MRNQKIPEGNKVLFDKYSKTIDEQINKKQSKWNLTAIPSISFDDVSQILRLHIYKKIHLYNPKKSAIECWLNVVISHQLKNLWRSLYINYNKPCISCACSQGENGCMIFGEQSEECPLYKHWIKVKLSAYNTKLPLSMENHEQEVFDTPHSTVNIEMTAYNLHQRMEKELSEEDYKVYKLLYIEHKEECDIIKTSQIKITNSQLQQRIRQINHADINKIKKIILEKAKELLEKDEIDIVEN